MTEQAGPERGNPPPVGPPGRGVEFSRYGWIVGFVSSRFQRAAKLWWWAAGAILVGAFLEATAASLLRNAVAGGGDPGWPTFVGGLGSALLVAGGVLVAAAIVVPELRGRSD